jgi:hypothetical protein
VYEHIAVLRRIHIVEYENIIEIKRIEWKGTQEKQKKETFTTGW